MGIDVVSECRPPLGTDVAGLGLTNARDCANFEKKTRKRFFMRNCCNSLSIALKMLYF